MKEINKDFYCSAGKPWIGGLTCVPQNSESQAKSERACFEKCDCYHRKHPTPEQFKEEYGEEYPKDGAIYLLKDFIGKQAWVASVLSSIDTERFSLGIAVCACTPFGKPDNDWRPE
jgi:hypothetical protein